MQIAYKLKRIIIDNLFSITDNLRELRTESLEFENLESVKFGKLNKLVIFHLRSIILQSWFNPVILLHYSLNLVLSRGLNPDL